MSRRKLKDRTSTPFEYSLAIASMFGFLAIIFASFLDFFFLSDRITSITLMVLGVGLAFEGKFFKIFRRSFRTYGQVDLSKVITAVVGIMVFVAGVLTFAGFEGPGLAAFRGIVSVIALIVIAIETFFVK